MPITGGAVPDEEEELACVRELPQKDVWQWTDERVAAEEKM
jgi:hypothetical protein